MTVDAFYVPRHFYCVCCRYCYLSRDRRIRLGGGGRQPLCRRLLVHRRGQLGVAKLRLEIAAQRLQNCILRCIFISPTQQRTESR